jgi:hypothetical protein
MSGIAHVSFGWSGRTVRKASLRVKRFPARLKGARIDKTDERRIHRFRQASKFNPAAVRKLQNDTISGNRLPL